MFSHRQNSGQPTHASDMATQMAVNSGINVYILYSNIFNVLYDIEQRLMYWHVKPKYFNTFNVQVLRQLFTLTLSPSENRLKVCN